MMTVARSTRLLPRRRHLVMLCLGVVATFLVFQLFSMMHAQRGAPALRLAALTYDKVDGQFRPINCQHMLSHVPDYTTDPNNGTKHQRETRTEVPFWISLHHEKFDPTRWDCIWNRGVYYEGALQRVWKRVLKSAPPNVRILDVGGNIGYYSLFTSSLGNFTIDSFEPNLKNVLRFCESLTLNGWSPPKPGGPHVTINNIGISDQPGILTFYEHTNPGAGGFYAALEKTTVGSMDLPVVTLDYFVRTKGWFNSRPRIEILKVDVERLEPQVVLGSKDLLKSGLVRNIFMETAVKDQNDMEKEIAAVQLLIDSGYKVAGQGNWRGPEERSPWPHDGTLVTRIFEHVKNTTDPFVNLWWTLDEKHIIT